MIRLTWRQFRNQAGVAGGLLVVAAILLALTGPHFAHIYDVYAKALGEARPARSGRFASGSGHGSAFSMAGTGAGG